VLHLYDRALLNGAALRAVGYTKDTPQAGEIQRDKKGNPTGILIAKPNSYILYSSIFKGPKLSREDQLNSSRLFFRELNRFGITSVVDAGGGFQNYPDDYEVVNELHQANQLTIRLASLTSAFSAMLRVLQCVALAGLLDVVSLMIDATLRSLIVRPRPGRGASLARASVPPARNRLRHRAAFSGVMPSSAAISRS